MKDTMHELMERNAIMEQNDLRMKDTMNKLMESNSVMERLIRDLAQRPAAPLLVAEATERY